MTTRSPSLWQSEQSSWSRAPLLRVPLPRLEPGRPDTTCRCIKATPGYCGPDHSVEFVALQAQTPAADTPHARLYSSPSESEIISEMAGPSLWLAYRRASQLSAHHCKRCQRGRGRDARQPPSSRVLACRPPHDHDVHSKGTSESTAIQLTAIHLKIYAYSGFCEVRARLSCRCSTHCCPPKASTRHPGRLDSDLCDTPNACHAFVGPTLTHWQSKS